MRNDDGELWTKHSGELIRFATMLVGPADAEDVLTNAFLAATATPAWPTVTNRRAYLFRTVANHAHRHRRTLARRLDREVRAAAGSATGEHEPHPEVLAALARLTVRQRAVVWLTYWLDLSPDGVADVLAISPRSVERELQRSRARLKGWLQ